MGLKHKLVCVSEWKHGSRPNNNKKRILYRGKSNVATQSKWFCAGPADKNPENPKWLKKRKVKDPEQTVLAAEINSSDILATTEQKEALSLIH